MLTFMQEIVGHFLDWVYSLMPLSPFAGFISDLAELPYLNYLNWFVPIGTFIKIGNAWLIAIFLWYMYGIVLRWIKAIS